VFVACTGDDENNILAAIEAKDVGAKKVMSIVGRPDYAAVMSKVGIDLAVSPRQVMARQVMGFLHSGPVVSRTSLAGGEIGLFEIDVLPESPATEHVLARLELPQQCLIAAVMREEYVRVPGADDRMRAGDTVIALVEESAVDDMLKVFGANGR
jgi:trk system potassium uptake protein TrkA